MNSVYIFTTRYSGNKDYLFSDDSSISHILSESEPLMKFYLNAENHDVVIGWIRHIVKNDAALAASAQKVVAKYEPELPLEELVMADLLDTPDLYTELMTAFGEYVNRYQYERFCATDGFELCERYLTLISADNVYCLSPLPEFRNISSEDDRKWVSALVEQFASSENITDVYLVLHDKDLSFTKTQPYMVLEKDDVPCPCGCTKRIHVIVFQHSVNAVMNILTDVSCQDVGSCVRQLHAERARIRARERASRCWRNAEAMRQLTEDMNSDGHLQEFYPGLTAEDLLKM